jgi:tetratricopeptide (TPR) repeat protein
MSNLQYFLLTAFLLLVAGVARADGITSISKTNKLLNQAGEAMKKNDRKSAIRDYEAAFKEDPELPVQARMNLAHAYYEEKDFKKALKNYQTIVSGTASESLKSVASQQIGNIYFTEKNYKAALDWYKKSLRTNPFNENARYNYELAYNLLKKQEEQQKNDPSQTQKQTEDQNKKPQNQPDSKNQKSPGQEQKSEKEKEDPQKKGSPQDKKQKQDNQNKPGAKPQPGEGKSEADQKQEGGQTENPDDAGKDKSNEQTRETNMDNPESQQMDKQKLKESGLTEEQARSLLQAMRQSEVKYLQQRRFRSKKGGTDRNKPKW